MAEGAQPPTSRIEIDSSHEEPRPGHTLHRAAFSLDLDRGLDLAEMIAAGRELAAAGVPLSAKVQMHYGAYVIAEWVVEDEPPA